MKFSLLSLVRKRVLLCILLLCLLTAWTDACFGQSRAGGPCDIYASSTTPCVAAFSTTRALYASYTKALYQITRAFDNTTTDIGILSDGFANAAAQDAFCEGTTCTISEIYDQSPHHNNLTLAPPGGEASGKGPGGYDLGAVANAAPVMAGGHKVYGVNIVAGEGYRNDKTSGIAVNGAPEGVYMVSSAIDLNGGCCFDFGNAETSNNDNGAGHLDAINLMCLGNQCSPVAGLDMENGIYGSLAVASGTPFVTSMGLNDGQHNYQIYQGNAQSGSLTTTGSIALPSGYSPMHQEGAIILGIGGDNSDTSTGYFFEGVMTTGAPSTTTMSSVQANIVSAAYGGLQAPVTNPVNTSFSQEGELINAAPSLAVLSNRMYVAFRAQNGVNTLFLDTSSDGVNLTGAQELTSIKMGSSPSIMGFRGQLWLAFKSASNNDLFLCSLTPNLGASPISYSNAQCTDETNYQIQGTPSLTNDGQAIYVAYLGTKNQLGITSIDGGDGPLNLSTKAGSPPAVAYYNNQLVLTFQSDDASHSLFTQTITTTPQNGYGNIASAIEYATKINTTPAVTVTSPGTANSTMVIAFWGNSPNTNLWYEDYFGTILQSAEESTAEVGSAPAVVTWTPTSGSYAGSEVISTAFRSQNSSDHLFLGTLRTSY